VNNQADILNEILSLEGGYIHKSPNHIGPVKFGISRKVYSNYLGRIVTNQEIRDMTEQTAEEIYERSFFTNPRIHTLSKTVQMQLFHI
jgi:lysozyme family protein